MTTSTEQSTLHDIHDMGPFEEETVARTVVFRFRPLTTRKQQRLDAAIASARHVRAEAARRLPSVPTYRWSNSTDPLWAGNGWGGEISSHLSNNTVRENILCVCESFTSQRELNDGGERPDVAKFRDAPYCAFKCSQADYKQHDGTWYISLLLEAGKDDTRELLPLRPSAYQHNHAQQLNSGALTKGRVELHADDNGYQLHQSYQDDVQLLTVPETAVGVDIGLKNLVAVGAIDGGGTKAGAELWSGSEMGEMRARFNDRRGRAQSDGDHQDIRNDEHRYVDHVCHTVSRQVVEWACGQYRPGIVMEDLTHIRNDILQRERTRTADDRRALHSWPFRQLQDMIEYKATEAGIPCQYVSPSDTSKRCNECGHVAGENRDGLHFACADCGYQVNADVNAAFNIAGRSDI